MLDRLEWVGLRSTRALSVIGLAALMFLAVLTLADGLLRWLFNAPIEGARDLGGLAIAIAITCCIPVGLMERSNISIRFIEPIAGKLASRLCDALASIATGLVMAGFAWQFWVYAGKLSRYGETTWVLKVPTAPYWYVVAAIFGLGVLVQLIVIAIDIVRLFAGGSNEDDVNPGDVSHPHEGNDRIGAGS